MGYLVASGIDYVKEFAPTGSVFCRSRSRSRNYSWRTAALCRGTVAWIHASAATRWRTNPIQKRSAAKFVRSQSGHAARSDPATPCTNLQQSSPEVSQIGR